MVGRTVDGILELVFASLGRWGRGTTLAWDGRSPAPLDRCAELLGVDLASLGEAATTVEPTSAPTAPASGA